MTWEKILSQPLKVMKQKIQSLMGNHLDWSGVQNTRFQSWVFAAYLAMDKPLRITRTASLDCGIGTMVPFLGLLLIYENKMRHCQCLHFLNGKVT